MCRKEHSCEGCINGNKRTVANAGTDQVINLPTNSVLLDGRRSSDPDGAISSFLWSKISGPATFNINSNASSLTVTKNLVAGTYLFELKVTDNSGLSAKDTVMITVDAVATANHPPIADAGPDQVIILPTNTVTINGSASTDEATTLLLTCGQKFQGPHQLILSIQILHKLRLHLLLKVHTFSNYW